MISLTRTILKKNTDNNKEKDIIGEAKVFEKIMMFEGVKEKELDAEANHDEHHERQAQLRESHTGCACRQDVERQDS